MTGEILTKSIQLPPDHRRILSVTARTVEDTVDELEQLLRVRGIERLTTAVKPLYSDEKRERLLASLAALRRANEELVRKFDLPRSVVAEDQIVSASLVNLWTILVDSTAKGTKGYGKLEPDVAAKLDESIGKLLAVVDGLP